MGIVRQINVKPERAGKHGLPKAPVASVELGASGPAGDFNRYRHETLHDEPDSAVLIVPWETLRALQSEGWPVQAGDLGENFTTEGIPYEAMRPGTRVHLGRTEVQVTRACDPCDNLYLLPYVGRTRGPEFLKVMLGRRGWYAKVLTPGTVRVGDPVRAGP
jgi:MOSC domain-containing protein YiiM